jgi:phosphatidylserine synthase
MIGCAVRLAYFNISTNGGNVKYYTGLSVDHNGMAFALMFLLRQQSILLGHVVDDFIFSFGLTLLLLTLTFMNLSNFKIPKPQGWMWWAFVFGNAILAILHAIHVYLLSY